MNKEELLNRLKDLRRDTTQENPSASVFEAIDTLISICEFLLNSYQPERLNPEDHFVGVNEMVCDSLNTANK